MNIELTPETESKLKEYAHKISETNRMFNLTGIKNVEEIFSELILGSISPVAKITVPRGTGFIDVGSGAGIPGIPLALFHPGFNGLLLEANNKKADFILSMIGLLDLKNVKVRCNRAEDIAGEPGLRESFDRVFSRALNNIYIALELCAPFVKPNGFVYIYSNLKPDNLPAAVLELVKILGCSIVPLSEYEAHGVSGGILIKKDAVTPEKYPRRFSILKRESKKVKWE